MNRKQAIRKVRRKYQLDPRITKVRGRHGKDGVLELVVHDRSGSDRYPGRKQVVARGRTWGACLNRLGIA